MRQKILGQKISVNDIMADNSLEDTNPGKENDLVAELCSNLFDNRPTKANIYGE